MNGLGIPEQSERVKAATGALSMLASSSETSSVARASARARAQLACVSVVLALGSEAATSGVDAFRVAADRLCYPDPPVGVLRTRGFLRHAVQTSASVARVAIAILVAVVVVA